MASIGPVALRIFENAASGTALIQVSYTLSATLHDAAHEQAYREVVQLIGDDTPAGPGEDGSDDLIPGGTMWDGVVVFTASAVAFSHTREITLPSQALDEDAPGSPLPRTDEIRARVTLTPLPPTSPSRESNLVQRGEPVIFPTLTG